MQLRILVAQTFNDILADSVATAIQRREEVTLVSDRVLRTDELHNWLHEYGVVPESVRAVGA